LLGALFSLVGSLSQLLGALISTPLIIKGLGRESYGVWNLVQDVVGYGSLADLGLGTSTVMHLAQYEGERNAQAYSNTLHLAKKGVRWQATVVCMALLVLVLVFPWVFRTQDVSSEIVRWTVLICGLRVAISLVGMTNKAILKSVGRYDWLNFQETLGGILMTVTLVVVAAEGASLIALGLSQFLVVALSQLGFLRSASQFQDRSLLTTPQNDPELQEKLMKYGRSTIWSKVAGRINSASGSLILGFLQGPASLADYSPAVSLTTRFSNTLVSALGFLGPVMARSYGAGDQAGLRRVFLLASRFTVCLSLLLSWGFFLFGREFLQAWLDDNEIVSRCYPLLVILGLSLLVGLPGIPGNSLLLALGDVELLRRRGVSEAIFCSLLQVVMGWWMGPLGIVIATVLSMFAIRGLMQLSLVGLRLHESPGTLAVQSYLRPLICLIPVVVVGILLKTVCPLGQLRELLLAWGFDLGEPTGRTSRLLAVGEISLHGLVMAAIMGIGCLWFCLDAGARELVLHRWGGRRKQPTRKTATEA
jgi:O-antigen/teichoic acid export membrane protein